MIAEMNERSRIVFRYIVDSYLGRGEPVGSRTIARHAGLDLSPASIRNVMADLEAAGLLYAPHASAGRLPTEIGMRLYVDGLMQIGNLSPEERRSIEESCAASGRRVDEILEDATARLSGLSACAGIIIAPKIESAVRQIQFVQIAPRKAIAILVFQNGLVENRIIDSDQDLSFTALSAASNYLNAKLSGKSLQEAEIDIRREIDASKTRLDTLTQSLVEKGLALAPATPGRIIVRGQSRLLEDVRALEDLERARQLLARLEQQQDMLDLLGTVEQADGVKIFIGAENKIFNQAGWSVIISPFRDRQDRIVGAVGVIGPTRLDYDRIVPMVDYTSQVISRLVENA